jgi:hypothetical protein
MAGGYDDGVTEILLSLLSKMTAGAVMHKRVLQKLFGLDSW